jgi:subtilase family serine protease
LPTSLAAGPYYLIAVITDVNGNAQMAASASTVAVAPAFIDLSGALAPVPSVLKLGKKTSATVTVTNNGNVPAAGTFQVAFLARPTGTTGAVDVPMATVATRINLASHGSKRLRFSLVVPVTLTAGIDYTLVAMLDPNNLFRDSNPGNNTLVGTFVFMVK